MKNFLNKLIDDIQVKVYANRVHFYFNIFMSQIIRQRNPDEPKMIPNGEPIIAGEFRIGAVINFPILEDRGKGYEERIFEKYVRSPGTRIITVKDKKIYLQKEQRTESLYAFDWRLPGGKVIDTFAEHKQYLSKPIPEEIVLNAALKELQEEAHMTGNAKFFTKKICGTTVEWDLYYIVVDNVTPYQVEYEHKESEQVEESGWFTFEEVLEKCKKGEISEGRTVAALFEFISR